MALDSVVAKLLVQQQEASERQQRLIVTLASLIQNNKGGSSLQQQQQPEALADIISRGIHEFIYDPDNNQIFSNWFSRYEQHFTEDAKSLDDACKVRLLLRKLSPQVYEQYANCILPKLPKDCDFQNTVRQLKKLFDRQESIFSVRYKCLQITKEESEDYTAYSGRVNSQCEKFFQGKMSSAELKVLIFICGLRSPAYNDIRGKLLSMLDTNVDTTLEQLTSAAQRQIVLRDDTKLVETTNPSTVNAISADGKSEFRSSKQKLKSHTKPTNQVNEVPKRPCWQCGAMHFVKYCTYSQHKCKDCDKIGHKEGYCSCFSKRASTLNSGQRKINRNTQRKFQQRRNFRTKVVVAKHSVKSINNINMQRKYINVVVNSCQIKLQFDTAADISLISKINWAKLGKPALHTCEHKASDASKNQIPLMGQFEAIVTHKNTSHSCIIYVTSLPNLNIFGIDLIEKFGYWDTPIRSVCNVITSNMNKDAIFKVILSKYPEVVQQHTGHCTKFKVNLEIKQNCKPVFKTKRPVPYASLAAVEQELNRLQDENIITPITQSDWAAPIVVVRKPNNRIRICADYSTGLNDCMKPNLYPIPHADDIFAQMSLCKYFSKIDLSDAYLQLEVDDESKKILTINTHKGLRQVLFKKLWKLSSAI
ncbi:PREDICTED: uncharacterized protein K02A2.6-like [Rhagoletis zephyria]|uniref:uncharacterized protein K02A2.6-like n=1 Tax=Rhagoletis zephyria TaxID=28612 RepID=UPI00081193E6|nr:PREDICTED: uncharacterized protein K02A2.6-like [Rhagoletis zephyria]